MATSWVLLKYCSIDRFNKTVAWYGNVSLLRCPLLLWLARSTTALPPQCLAAIGTSSLKSAEQKVSKSALLYYSPTVTSFSISWRFSGIIRNVLICFFRALMCNNAISDQFVHVSVLLWNGFLFKDNVDWEVGLNFARFGAYWTCWPGRWRIAQHTITTLHVRSYEVMVFVFPLFSYFEKSSNCGAILKIILVFVEDLRCHLLNPIIFRLFVVLCTFLVFTKAETLFLLDTGIFGAFVGLLRFSMVSTFQHPCLPNLISWFRLVCLLSDSIVDDQIAGSIWYPSSPYGHELLCGCGVFPLLFLTHLSQFFGYVFCNLYSSNVVPILTIWKRYVPLFCRCFLRHVWSAS